MLNKIARYIKRLFRMLTYIGQIPKYYISNDFIDACSIELPSVTANAIIISEDCVLWYG